MLFPAKQLLRRYTPPTCTLDLWVMRSRLDRFFNKAYPQDWQFELRFDDPRTPEEEQITLKGDRQQLDSLYEIVGSYLQNFLQETRRFWAASATGEGLPRNIRAVSPPDLAVISPNLPYLRSQGQLNHELHGGALIETTSKAIVTLSTSQLFDLTQALDDYQRDLPRLLNPQPTPARRLPWLISGGLAIALGFIGFMVGQERWNNLFAPTAFSPNKNANPANPNPYLSAIPPVPLPPPQSIPAPSLAPTLANRDPLPLPPPATPGDPLARSANNTLQNPGLRVLPPPPVVPPAPPLPAGANSTVGLNPIPPTETLNIPALPPRPNSPISPLKKLPSPPPLLSQSEDSASSAIAFRPDRENLAPRDQISAHRSSPAQTRLLDTVPQVAEVRSYFQQKWKKPPDLNQNLEYRLSIKTNGSLARIVPLGKAAIIYQPQVGMPGIGEVFVSPLRQQADQTIRLVLDLEGKVSTFLESDY